MTKYAIQQSVFTAADSLQIAPFAQITIANASDDSAAELWDDAAGTEPISGNVVNADEKGFFRVYVSSGIYDIAILANDITTTLRDVDIGIADGGQYAVDQHVAASDPHGDRAFATAAISTHSIANDPHGDRAFANKRAIVPLLSDDCVEHLKAHTARGRCYAIKDGNRSLFGIGMACNGFNAAEYEFTADADGFWRVRYGYTNQIREPSTTVQASNCRDGSDTPVDIATIGTSGDNKFFSNLQVGYKFDLPFTGTGLIFRHYADNRGGLWKITIDGTIERYVSCYVDGSPVSDNKPVVAIDLTDGAHTATFEFVGNDPDANPANLGTGYPRGWFKYDDGGSPTFTTGLVIDGTEIAMQWGGKTLTLTNILEFANFMTATGSGITGDWFPAHGIATGAMVINSRKLYINGNERPDDLSDWPSGIEFEIDDFAVVQAYTAYSSKDTKKAYPLMDGVVTHRFNRDGLTISNTMKALRSINVSDGYSAMIAGKISNYGEVRLDNGYSRTMVQPVSGNVEYEPGYCRSALMFNTTTGDAAALSVGSVYGSTSDGESWKQDAYPTLLTERSDDIQKLYFVQSGPDDVIPSGTKLQSCATLFQVAGYPLKSVG